MEQQNTTTTSRPSVAETLVNMIGNGLDRIHDDAEHLWILAIVGLSIYGAFAIARDVYNTIHNSARVQGQREVLGMDVEDRVKLGREIGR